MTLEMPVLLVPLGSLQWAAPCHTKPNSLQTASFHSPSPASDWFGGSKISHAHPKAPQIAAPAHSQPHRSQSEPGAGYPTFSLCLNCFQNLSNISEFVFSG